MHQLIFKKATAQQLITGVTVFLKETGGRSNEGEKECTLYCKKCLMWRNTGLLEKAGIILPQPLIATETSTLRLQRQLVVSVNTQVCVSACLSVRHRC